MRSPQYYEKKERIEHLPVEALKVLIYLKVNVFGKGFFSIKDASLELIPAISLKADSNTEAFGYGLFMVTLFKLSGNFLGDIFAKHFLTKLQASNPWVTTLLEMTCLKKQIELGFNPKGYLFMLCKKLYLYSNADVDVNANIDAEIRMPRFPNGLIKYFKALINAKIHLTHQLLNLC